MKTTALFTPADRNSRSPAWLRREQRPGTKITPVAGLRRLAACSVCIASAIAAGASIASPETIQPAAERKKIEETKMNDNNYTTSFTVEQSAGEVFNAITNPRGWWSQAIEGDTDKLGAEFAYHFKDLHRCRLKVIELVPKFAELDHDRQGTAQRG